MNVGNSDVVTIDNIISQVKMQLDVEAVTNYDDKIELFVNESAGKIDSNRLYIKKPCTIEVINGKGKLPKGFSEPVAARLMCHHDHHEHGGHEHEQRQNTLVSGRGVRGQGELLCVEEKFRGDFEGVGVFSRETIEFDSGYMWLSHPSNITHVELSYKGTIKDCYGIYVIYSDWAEAMREYATYKMLEIRPNLWDRKYFQFLKSTKDDHYANYVAAKDKIISVDAKKDFEANKYMIKRMYQAYQWNRNKKW